MSELPIVFNLDQEHRGIRYAVPTILFVAFLLSYFVVSAALRMFFPELNSVIVLSCLGAIPLSLLAAGASEAVLKRVWPSGRQLRVEPTRLELQLPESADRHFDLSERLNTVWWFLRLSEYPRGGRERRMPKNWYCVGGQLQQNETRMVAYCYASPKRMKIWREAYDLHELDPSEVYDSSFGARFAAPTRPDIKPEVIAGKEGRYWLAERNRWNEGVELTQEDFELFLQIVQAR